MSDMMTQEEAMNMSNEQAVQILIPMRNMMCDQNGCPISDAVFALDKAIEALSADRPQAKWIPCSERLPKAQFEGQRRGWYLTTNANGGVGETRYEFYHDFMKTGWQSDFRIVAWMPLPAPWKEGESNG